ncbi:MAG: SpoIIE family protein phosphatase [Pseudomonadales bacterium]|nr:SpoIIE family protein phosphatase [Pseudomonadales bacterium]
MLNSPLPSMKVLAVDDAPTSLFLMESIIEDMGLATVSASSGEAAIAIVENELPDLILMDVNMPGMDGYSAAKKIKDIAGPHHLPIIFITASSDDEILTKCVAIGDDYIAKPIYSDIVIAKIKAHLRVVELYKNMEKQNQALIYHQKHDEDERNMVQSIFDNFYLHQFDDKQRLKQHISPKSLFNGDILLTVKSPTEGLYIMMGDVTGHGLPAAVAAIPVYSAFRSMASRGVSIGVIAAELNKVLHHLLPPHIMLAATILEVNASGKRVTVWSGGMPPGIIADKEGCIVDFIHSKHAPLSVMDDDEFCQDVMLFKLKTTDRIYLQTDGIIESNNRHGDMFGEKRLNDLFDCQHPDMFQRILNALDDFTEGTEQDDDISLIELSAPQEQEECERSTPIQAKPLKAIPWQVNSTLKAYELQNTEPVTQMLKLLGHAIGLNVHQDYLSTILSEMFNNALEHGLLALDSSLKSTEDGYFEYYCQRKKRLQKLTEGFIKIQVTFCPQQAQVSIQVSQSGEGFDAPPDSSAQSLDSNQTFGRGISIIRNLCLSYCYSDEGRTATAVYQLPNH